MTKVEGYGQELTSQEVLDGLLYHANEETLLKTEPTELFSKNYIALTYTNKFFVDGEEGERRHNMVLWTPTALERFTDFWNTCSEGIDINQVFVLNKRTYMHEA